MRFEFESRTTPLDFWRLSMNRTYHSVAGVCNAVFTVSMILLSVKFWNQSDDLVQTFMFLGCILFPVIQPLAVYLKAKGQASLIPENMKLMFDDKGLHVTVGEQKEDIVWSKITGVIKKARLVIVFSDARHGYMLPYRVLGKDREDFYEFAKSKAERAKQTGIC